MSSPCLCGGGRSYQFDLEIVKSTATSTRTSHTSSPSSTISESSNSPLAISTRKPRTTRKRRNQFYNEAAALLSSAYPTIFSAKHLANPRKLTKPQQDALLLDKSLSSSESLWPFRAFNDDCGFLLHHSIRSEKSCFLNELKLSNLTTSVDNYSSCQTVSHDNFAEFRDGYEEDFDAESIFDEEIEEGVDSIMGNLSVSKENEREESNTNANDWYGYPMGFHFGNKFQLGFGNGIGKGETPLRQANENWWNFPTVDMLQISPRLSSSNHNKKIGSDFSSNSKTKKLNSGDKKKKKVEKGPVELKNLELAKENSVQQSNPSLLLKLNYDGVLKAWSDKRVAVF